MEKFGFGAAHAAKCVKWIRKWFEKNGKDCNAVVGISGGIDSSVVAALCVEALGVDRVIGVLMPNKEQLDIEYAQYVVELLGIKSYTINIGDAYESIVGEMISANTQVSNQTLTNLPARLRMSTLYAISQSNHGRVANTCNLSEDYVGYSTRYGDSVGDFAPLAKVTKSEVIEMGQAMGLPDMLMNKEPSDGLCGKTDEENLGFSYAVLDAYIRTGVCDDANTKKLIDDMHRKNEFKLQLMDVWNPNEDFLASLPRLSFGGVV